LSIVQNAASGLAGSDGDADGTSFTRDDRFGTCCTFRPTASEFAGFQVRRRPYLAGRHHRLLAVARIGRDVLPFLPLMRDTEQQVARP
jgi:hypothetical protein